MNQVKPVRELWLAATMVAAVVSFQAWTVTGGQPPPLFGGDQSDYYSLLSRSFLRGHLYLPLRPDPRLVHAEDPYNPAKRPPGVIVHDLSYYRGRYYLYFGVAPVVTLWLPWRLATGHDLPQVYGLLIFTAGGYLAAAGLWFAVRRRYFPESGALALAAGLGVLGLASMTHAVLRRAGVWEVPIASGYCFSMLMLACVFGSLHARRAAGWMAAAGLFLGLAVGSRPNLVFGGVALAAPLVLAWRRRLEEPGELRRRILAAGALFAAVLLGLLAYNHARFGNPFEFGSNLQLNADYEAMGKRFSADYIPFNAYLYYLAPAQWSRYFPFVEMVHAPPAPAGYYGIEYTYGVLVDLPFAWLALFAPLAWRGRPPDERDRLRGFVGAVAAFFFGVGGFLLLRWGATARYAVDFTPTLMLAASVGMLSLERAAPAGLPRLASRAAAAALAAFSIFVGTMLNFQLHEVLRQMHPESYRRIAHAFDTPVAAAERLLGTRFGPLDVVLSFPSGRAGKIEPLVATGWEYTTDHLFVCYLDGRRIQLGFDHTSHGLFLSRPVDIDYSRPHRLRVEMGSLLPPPGHPFFDRRGPSEADELAHRLRVSLDDRGVFDTAADFYDSSPGAIHVGRDPTGAYGGQFTGTILAIERESGVAPARSASLSGGAELDLAIPAGAVQPMPLVTTGRAGEGDCLSMRWVRPGVARFGYDDWGAGEIESAEVPVSTDAVHVLRIDLPSLLPPPATAEAAAARDSLRVRLDGKLAWARRVSFHPAPPEETCFGRNSIGSASCARDFPGRIVYIGRFPPPRPRPSPARGPVLLRLLFPEDQQGRSEPLVVTGVTGRADVLSVQYVDGGHIRFGLDHWAVSFDRSDPVAVDYGKVHALAIVLPTLDWPSPSDGARFTGPLEVLLDGAPVWRRTEEFYRSAPATLTIASNTIGASTCGEAFTGGIVEVIRPGLLVRDLQTSPR